MRDRLGLAIALALLLGGVQTSSANIVEASVTQLLQASPKTGAIHLAAAGDAEDLMRTLELERGKSVFVRTDYDVKRVSVGDPELLDVVVFAPRELQFVAKGTGSTNVLIWDTRGRPQASIQVQIGTPQIYLQRELRRILSNDDLHVDGARSATVLSGSVPNVVALEQTLAVANAFVADDENAQVVNLLEVGGNQQVMLKVVIAEMSRTLTREFGTNFNALIDAGTGKIRIDGLLGGLTTPGLGAGDVVKLNDAVNLAAGFFNFGGLEQLAVFLDILDERGLSKILAEPALVARSGESASFLVGGEVPVPIAQGGAFGSITVEYKKFGVGLSFTPTVLAPDRIHLTVSPEVSRPDFAFGTEVQGTVVPAFNSRRASTSVDLEHGQTLAIAGLLSEVLQESVSEYPILGRIPIIGGLFRASRFEKQETELVILVTPVLAQPTGTDPTLPTDFFIEPSASEFFMYGWLEGRAPIEEEPAGLIGEAGYRISPDTEEAHHE
jgi:pilus assembly protein CpaC